MHNAFPIPKYIFTLISYKINSQKKWEIISYLWQNYCSICDHFHLFGHNLGKMKFLHQCKIASKYWLRAIHKWCQIFVFMNALVYVDIDIYKGKDLTSFMDGPLGIVKSNIRKYLKNISGYEIFWEFTYIF